MPRTAYEEKAAGKQLSGQGPVMAQNRKMKKRIKKWAIPELT